MQEKLPEGMRVRKIVNGAAEIEDGGDYEAKLILVPAPEPAACAAEGTAAEGRLGKLMS